MMTNFYSRGWAKRLASWATCLLLFLSVHGFSQTFYPRVDGNWSAGGSWSTVSCGGTNALAIPQTTSHSVSISCSGLDITVTATANAGALTISNGSLTVNSGQTLNVTSLTMTGGTLTVNGTLNITTGGSGIFSITGGTVTSTATGTIGLLAGNMNVNSTRAIPNVNISGTGIKTLTSDLNVLNKLTLTASNLAVSDKLLTVGSSTAGSGITATNGKLTLTSSSSLSFGGSWTNSDISSFISNTWPVTINNFTMTRNLCDLGLGTNKNLTVNGAFTLTAGDFSIGSSTLTLNGAISGSISGAVKGGGNSNLTIGGTGVASMYLDLGNTGTNGTNTINNFTNNRTSHPFIMLSSLRIKGVLTQAATASLQISNSGTNTLSLDGTVSGTARLVGHANAILHVNGSGNLGGTLAFASSPQLANFTMNRIGGSATFSSAFSTGGMSLNFGVVNNPSGITVNGTAPGNVVQSVSSSYINGPLSRTIPANASDATYSWPIGAAASQKFELRGISTGGSGNVVITAQAFDGDANGQQDTTISNLNTDHYWSASASNPGNLISAGLVSLSDNGLQEGNAVGYSATLNGTYTSLGGTIESGSVTSSVAAPNALGYFVVGSGESVCTDPTVATINASALTNCGTQSTTLTIASGNLNSATAWNWYSGSCGGTLVGTGASINVSPTQTTTYFVRGEGGCITPGECASVTITVNTPQIWYADADGDLFGNPNVSQLACTQPVNYVSDNTDCDDTNSAKHETFAFYADVDGDQFGAGPLVQVCAENAQTAPVGYSTNNTDCDDTDASVFQSADLFVDADLDGYTSGAVQTVCYGNVIPSGYLIAATAIDCNDTIGAIHPNAPDVPYNGVDDNCDGTADETGTIFTTLLPSSCGVTLNSLQSLIGIQTVSGHQITGYRIRATNGAQVQTIETTVPHFNMTQFANYAYATTYSIDVQLQRAGLWQASWGAACFVSTPAILQQGGSAAVNPLQCGITLNQINTLIATSSIAGVTGYRFRVTNLTDPVGPNAVQTVDRVQNWFTLQMLTRYNYGTLYRVEVSVKTTGTYGGYGSACEINSPAVPSMLNCGVTVPAMTSAVPVSSTVGAAQYRFQITRVSDGASATIDRSTNFFTFNLVPASVFTPAAEYAVRVAIMTTGNWSPFSDACDLIAPGTAAKYIADSAVVESVKASAYPNPFISDFNLELMETSGEQIQVRIYDMLGKLMESVQMNAADLASIKIGAQYPSGVYNVILNQDGTIRTLRVIKR